MTTLLRRGPLRAASVTPSGLAALAPCLLGFLALSLAPAPAAAAAQGPELDAKEHRDLGRIFGKYFDDKAKDEQREKARNEIASALEKIGKKKGAKEATEALQAGLRMTADLGAAMYHAGRYDPSLKGGKTTVEEIDLGGKEKLPYGLWLPPTYKSTGAPLPLILVIPGTKEDGKPMSAVDFLTEHFEEPDLRAGAIVAVVTMPATVETWTGTEGLGAVLRTYGDVSRRATVDFDRIYLLGRGEGVAAAMHIASCNPHRFAAVIGLTGDAGKVGHENFHNLPTLFQGSGAEATEFERKNKEAGYNNCTIQNEVSLANAWTWIQQTPRVSNPAKITLAPGTPIPNRAYWFEMQATEGVQGVLTAEADRSTNTIKITAAGVRRVFIYYNNEIVDLSKPVKIVLNGQEQQETVVGSLEDLFELYRRASSDPGRMYVARRPYDVPEG